MGSCLGLLEQQEEKMIFPAGTGEITPFTTCPHCSVLVNGTCFECDPASTHPSCQNCVNGEHQPPWYQGLFQTLLLSVTVGVATAIILRGIDRKLKR